MNAITHHSPDSLLAAFAAGVLEHPFALVVASHISMCLDCRATFEAHLAIGGAVLESGATAVLSSDLKGATLSQLDHPVTPRPEYGRKGIFPSPVVEALKGQTPRWKSLGMGARQSILSQGSEGSVRLLYIPPGQAVPDHSHNGMELTLVLQGSFSDSTGRFGVGDLEVADHSLEHSPKADDGAACICLAATDAPLRFAALLPRLLQPLFRI
ncbi:ChrR family anti-sigma-E factor [Sulfitobacter sp. F26204]|uniref:ChrR family anti-sigma-E factor n=1 Tax=Sulfitobacter sp. F26204 TaxID=2996014 RepID=UPI00225DEB3A|nr:ChrR family anti-sigma-E factor [Sulfitobacter sp. F26204]MCX7561137.1 ChrR family anti-sigma-E factor [Sulfitobacter sp. F26204]